MSVIFVYCTRNCADVSKWGNEYENRNIASFHRSLVAKLRTIIFKGRERRIEVAK